MVFTPLCYSLLYTYSHVLVSTILSPNTEKSVSPFPGRLID